MNRGISELSYSFDIITVSKEVSEKEYYYQHIVVSIDHSSFFLFFLYTKMEQAFDEDH